MNSGGFWQGSQDFLEGGAIPEGNTGPNACLSAGSARPESMPLINDVTINLITSLPQ